MSVIESIPLSLAETIGSLMTSVIDAQAQSAKATVEFIEDVGTLEGASDLEVLHQLRTVSFQFKKFDENFENKKFQIDVPLLSMVDIPLIAVKTATFHFNYDITQTTKETSQSSDTAQPSLKSKIANNVTNNNAIDNNAIDNKVVLGSSIKRLPIAKPATIVGKFQKTSSNTTVTEKGGLDVTIELEKAALPVGLERILEMLEQTSMESQVEDDNDQ